MKAQRIEVERVIKVRVVHLELEPREAAALVRATDRCIELSKKEGNFLDVERFTRFRIGLVDASETPIEVTVEDTK